MSDYSRVFGEYRTTARKIATIKESLQKAEQEREYKLFLLKELDELNWRTGEGKEIEEELNMLTHADQVRTGIAKIGLGLSEGEQPMLSALRSMVAQLQGLQSYHSAITPLAERMNAVHVELKDIAGDLQSLFEKISVDDKKMDAFNDRISTAQRLAKKHGLSDLNELVDKRSILEEELSVFEKSSHSLEGLEKDLDRFQKMAEKLAGDLRKSRQAEIPQLEENTQLLLKRVGMPNAALKIALKPVELSASGIDLVEFLFDANKSGQFESLQKVASGGELSRLMLVLKSLVADSMEMPTLIFDEIDSGISGEAAKQVGMLMEELSANHQLIAITHQPQIAAKAEQHLFVYKKEENGQINTGIRMLSQEERVQAIAQMLAGENPSEAVMASAREMMKKG